MYNSTTQFGVLLFSSELANYVMVGDYLACASVASSTVPGYDGSGSDKCAVLGECMAQCRQKL